MRCMSLHGARPCFPHPLHYAPALTLPITLTGSVDLLRKQHAYDTAQELSRGGGRRVGFSQLSFPQRREPSSSLAYIPSRQSTVRDALHVVCTQHLQPFFINNPTPCFTRSLLLPSLQLTLMHAFPL